MTSLKTKGFNKFSINNKPANSPEAPSIQIEIRKNPKIAIPKKWERLPVIPKRAFSRSPPIL